MAVVLRIDVDRPYGKQPVARHLLSRLSSDLYFPKIGALGYLKELERFLDILAEYKARSYVFFRQCTLPPERMMSRLRAGGHEIGLHLENSRSFETFAEEKRELEKHTGAPVRTVSKHGSGKHKYGRRHYAPYQPDKYLEWAERARMKMVFGNLEDAALTLEKRNGMYFFPAAFWLEPSWRDVRQFTLDWLVAQAEKRDVVVLVHPENVLEKEELTSALRFLLSRVRTAIYS